MLSPGYKVNLKFSSTVAIVHNVPTHQIQSTLPIHRLVKNITLNCSWTAVAHVVYMLKCPCGLVYVRQTKRALRTHISKHKTAIHTKNIDHAMAQHCAQASHGSAATLKFWGIDKATPASRGGDLINTLLRKDVLWIYNLNTVEPPGINEELNLSCFL